MATADLYGVTASLRNLLRYNIFRISGLVVDVGDLPPERAAEEGTALNLHLFHALEDASRRNEFARDSGSLRPVSEAPLVLVLHYALTAHGGGNTPDVPGQQLLMGLAMKTLHDFPDIDEALQLPTPPAFAPDTVFDTRLRGGGNRIGIVPRQMAPEESINFWSAAQNQTPRLTAYYEVRSTLLMPEEPSVASGLVTSYGLGVAAGGRPRLLATRSRQSVALPEALGGAATLIEQSPGEPALGGAAGADELVVTGSDLGDGSDATLLLQGPGGEIVLDPAANPAWAVRFAAAEFRLRLQPTVAVAADGGIVQQPVVPGIWSLALRRARRLAVSAGAPRTVDVQSNRVPFAVGVSVLALTPLPLSQLHIDLAPGVDAQQLQADSALAIGGETYRWHPPTDPAPLVAGDYQAISATRILVLLRFDPLAGGTRALRLGMAGVDAPPVWLQ